jgi:hypothetical protein
VGPISAQSNFQANGLVFGGKVTVPCKYASECWGDYSFCGQLIKWNDNTHSIRLAYYRRRCGDDCWEYASQMTVNAEWQIIKPLLERTLAKKSWFQEPPLPCT